MHNNSWIRQYNNKIIFILAPIGVRNRTNLKYIELIKSDRYLIIIKKLT